MSHTFLIKEGALYRDKASNILRLEHIDRHLCEYSIVHCRTQSQSGVVRGFVKKALFRVLFAPLNRNKFAKSASSLHVHEFVLAQIKPTSEKVGNKLPQNEY